MRPHELGGFRRMEDPPENLLQRPPKEFRPWFLSLATFLRRSKGFPSALVAYGALFRLRQIFFVHTTSVNAHVHSLVRGIKRNKCFNGSLEGRRKMGFAKLVEVIKQDIAQRRK